jgi:MFS family permease
MKALELIINKQNNNRELRNILLFFTGKSISVFGSAIYTFAMSLYVLKATGSGLSFAGTLILGIVPAIILNPIAGAIADKYNKKAMTIIMDILNGILLIGVYLFSQIYDLNLTIIYLTTFVMTVFTTFFAVSVESSKPNIVSDKKLLNINSVSRIIDSISQITGPMLGGLVFAVLDIRTFIVINGVSYIFSALCETFIDFNFNKQNREIVETPAKLSIFADIKDGFKYLIERDNLKGLFGLMVSLNFFLGFAVTVPMPYIINTVLKLGSSEFGIIEGAFPIGIIVGALFVKKVCEKVSYSKLLKTISYMLSAFMFALGLPILLKSLNFLNIVYVVYYVVIMAAFGITISMIDIPIAYLIQRIIPDEYRGRVMSLSVSLCKVMFPIALLISGALLNMLPTYVMPVSGGAMLLLLNIFSLKKVGLNNII